MGNGRCAECKGHGDFHPDIKRRLQRPGNVWLGQNPCRKITKKL
jgi:hypothetical protein